MAKISVQAGSTGVTLPVFIQATTSTGGAGLTGLTGTAAGLTAAYYRGTGTDVPITLTTSSLTAAYTSGLLVEVNSTRMPGAYRFDVPDAALVAGARSCVVMLQGAANMAPLPLEVEITAWNNQDPNAGGMTQLSSTGTLGSVSNVRGTATVLLAAGTHVGAVIPIVQTASVALTANTVGTASGVNSPTAAQITTAVWAAFGTGIVQLNTGTHTGAVIPQVNIVQTSADGRMANLDALVSSRSTAGDAMTLTTGERTAVADRFLDRDMSSGTDSGSASVRTARQALRQLRNKWQVSTGTLTVFKEDDATISWTATISSTSSADAIVGSDPA